VGDNRRLSRAQTRGTKGSTSRMKSNWTKQTRAGRKKVGPRVSCSITKHAWTTTNAVRAQTQAKREDHNVPTTEKVIFTYDGVPLPERF